MFVSGMVGLVTLLILVEVDSPSAQESIHFYVPNQYTRRIRRRQHSSCAIRLRGALLKLRSWAHDK